MRSYIADDIIKKLSRYETVSFDIFDTLIKRCFASPRDVFLRTAKDFSDKSKRFIDPVKFQQDRINAERIAITFYLENNTKQHKTRNNA